MAFGDIMNEIMNNVGSNNIDEVINEIKDKNVQSAKDGAANIGTTFIKIGNLKISLKWNPFRKLVTDRHHFFEYLLQSSWWEKVKDTSAFFAGKKQNHDYNKRPGEIDETHTLKYQRTIGLLDLLIVPLILELLMVKFGAFQTKKFVNTKLTKPDANLVWTLVLFPISILLLPINLFNRVFDLIKNIVAAIITIPLAIPLMIVQGVIALGKKFGKIEEIADERNNAALENISRYENSTQGRAKEATRLPKDILDRKNYHIDMVNVQEDGNKIQVTMTKKKPLSSWGHFKDRLNETVRSALNAPEMEVLTPDHKVYQFGIDMTNNDASRFFKHNPYGLTRKIREREIGEFSEDYSTFIPTNSGGGVGGV